MVGWEGKFVGHPHIGWLVCIYQPGGTYINGDVTVEQ